LGLEENCRSPFDFAPNDRERREVEQGSAEEIFHLAQQTARSGLVLDVHGFAQLAKQIALRLGELLWRLHHNLHYQVSPAVLVEMRHTLAAQTVFLAGLRALMDPQRGVSFKRRYLNLVAQRNLRK